MTKRKLHATPTEVVMMVATRYDKEKCVGCGGKRNAGGYPICNDCGRRNTPKEAA